MGLKPRPARTDREALCELLAPNLVGTAGAALMRPGLATSPAWDRVLACGWPHIRVVDPDHPDNRSPRAGAKAHLSSASPYATAWPSRVAPIAIRAKLAGLYDAGRPSPLDPLVDGVSHGPMSVDEGVAIIRRRFGVLGWPWGRIWSWLIEALIGAEPVAEALVTALESLDDAALSEFNNERGLQIWELGFVLLRVPVAAAAAFRERLEAVFERARAAYPWKFDKPDGSTGGMVARRLDVVLHGAAGAERSGYRIQAPGRPIDPSGLVFVTDDPDWLLAQLERWPVASDDPDDYTSFWFRPTYLAGERGIALEAGRWRDYPPEEHENMAEMMSGLASPAFATMLAEMGKR